MYLERRILRRTVSHAVPENNRLLSFTWMQGYQLGSQSQYESVYDDKKKNDEPLFFFHIFKKRKILVEV